MIFGFRDKVNQILCFESAKLVSELVKYEIFLFFT